MRAQLDNLGRRQLFNAGVAIGAAVLSALGLAGIAIRPAEDLADARALEARLVEDVARCSLERAALERFEAAHGFERLAQAQARVEGFLPREVSPVELHAAVRILARASDVELEQLHVPERPDAQAGPAGARPLEIAGTARPGAVVRLVEELAAHGYPTTVLEVAIARDDPSEPRFRFALSAEVPTAGDALGRKTVRKDWGP